MSKKSARLAAVSPRCRHCSRTWTPDEGVSADQSYCSRCSVARRTVAATALDLKPMRLTDMSDSYFLPRALRSR
jgi:hypothetical protein